MAHLPSAHASRVVPIYLRCSNNTYDVFILVKAGWGDWAKPGVGGMSISQKTLDKRNRLITKIQTEHDSKVMSRSDSKMSNVMLS